VKGQSVWLTVDTDDHRHVPRVQGHPKRSRGSRGEPSLSTDLLTGLNVLRNWVLEQERKVTLFVIADQLDEPRFVQAVDDLIATGRCTIGVHGMTHRCWSAYPPDRDVFVKEIGRAVTELDARFGESCRPWFRAPAGYVAPWMAQPLFELGFKVDSSINPSPLLGRFKSGGNGWDSVHRAITVAGLTERPWRTLGKGWFRFPTCGPAQHIPALGTLARASWHRLVNVADAEEDQIEDPNATVHTIYWHAKDHVRRRRYWYPPIGPPQVLT